MEIKFEQVAYTYHYRTPLAKTTLNNLSFTIPKHKITGVMGPVGSGKTTMLSLINALNLPTKGTITVGGYIIKPKMKKEVIKKLRQDVGFVWQRPEEQFFNLTVEAEVMFGLNQISGSSCVKRERLKQALKMVGLNESYLKRNPFTLSSGEQRKVALASVLVFNPKVIILDEPTVGLDGKSKNNLMHLIKRINKRYKKTIIICTHDVDLLQQISEQLVVLKAGELVITGATKQVFNKIKLFKQHKLPLPQINVFINKVKEDKGIKLNDCNDIRELIKDVYRNV